MTGDDITSPDGEATVFEPYDWQRALSASVAAHAERQALRRNERAEFARRRNYGLEQRQAAKLARNPTVSQTETLPTVGQRPTEDPRSHQ